MRPQSHPNWAPKLGADGPSIGPRLGPNRTQHRLQTGLQPAHLEAQPVGPIWGPRRHLSSQWERPADRSLGPAQTRLLKGDHGWIRRKCCGSSPTRSLNLTRTQTKGVPTTYKRAKEGPCTSGLERKKRRKKPRLLRGFCHRFGSE